MSSRRDFLELTGADTGGAGASVDSETVLACAGPPPTELRRLQ